MYTVRFFAGLAERTGTKHVSLDLPEPTTVGSVRQAFQTMFPDAQSEITTALAAVNQAYADDNQSVQTTDEIAWIPPVGGGAVDAVHSIRLTDTELSVEEAYKTLENPVYGGTVLFIGTVREWTGTKQTSHLSYETYVEMAKEQMRRIAEAVEAEYPGVSTLQWHRTGALYPTDIAVICAAASPHRGVAFTAARTLIERLKKEVPIWKKEFYADGNVTWQANPE
ncbi:molybdenum cofactor biosynthesis protein MoaE [Alicyclobacillus fastidiosus]|uniref:Molybdenum cofactor biosynthesis protein MoaE n=1 Tax=Alicyclobacillus fastidiosus TaxID=392011 RepID=A0ABY6ZCS5_9BACL|nr:molybdenum cofactor biosynthesis protein MoaE [Alicyclobacillus fastidiosus]WAH40703.1 molybdenum cofactor biosynthesis protein MoaE [Alicyclobacillus fastidiosus]GMA62174.1 molybdopterin synthase sulfur carrier subunit [Alicyclobacillus fastidiosus]